MNEHVREERLIADPVDDFHRALVDGLTAPQKSIPARFFYDYRGSQLFEEITRLDAYYPTRTETALLASLAPTLNAEIGPGAQVIELGAGSTRKTRIVLGALECPAKYIAVDIAGDYLEDMAAELASEFPGLAIASVIGDFMGELPRFDLDPSAPRLGFFPGSTIGNLIRDDAVALLARQRSLLGEGARFLVGVDLVKEVPTLLRAYDDPEGVTAAFNLNVLERANRELGADFDVDGFAHQARWNGTHSRIEMHLVSRRAQAVRVNGHRFGFAAGETIHTENSHKYSVSSFARLAAEAGWAVAETWTDENALFSVHLLT